MDEELNNLAIGGIFLILIINMTMLMSITTSLYGPDVGQPVFSAPISPFPVLAASASADPPDLLVSLLPTIEPVINEGAALPDTNVIVSGQGPGATIKSISSYVTIEAKEPPEVVRHTCIQPEIPQRNETGYVTIYDLTNQKVSQVLPTVSFSLVNPPLVIDFSLIPADARDIKYIEYKKVSTQYEELIVLDRPYEDAWFTITVRNKDTGQLVTEDGFGRTYSFQSPRRLVVRESGNYSIECTGDYAKINLTMKVKPEGNFP